MKTIPAKEARSNLPALLDDASEGKAVLIMRHSRPAAALMPPEYAEIGPIIFAVVRELGESLILSNGPDVIAAFRDAQLELDRGDISWLD